MEQSIQHSAVIRALPPLLARGNYEQALQKIEGLLHSSTDSTTLLHYGGLCCFGLGHFAEAKGFFDKVLKIQPNHYAAIASLASCYIRLGRLSDGLFYHKLSIATEADSNTDLLPDIVDFASNLALWSEDKCLLDALSQNLAGQFIAAQKNLLEHLETKDPEPEVLHLIITLSLKIGDYSEALRSSVEYHRMAPENAAHNLLAAQVLSTLGQNAGMDDLLDVCLKASDCRVQAGALDIIVSDSLMSTNQQAEYITRSWSLAEQQALNPDQYDHPGVAKQTDHYSVGIFLGNLSLDATARWFLDALRYFDDSDVAIVLYLENADYWGRNYFRTHRYTTVETEDIDTETLVCIIRRNNHQILLDLSGFNASCRLDATSQFSDVHQIGLVDHPAHLKQDDRRGYDALLVQDTAASIPHCHPVSSLTFVPEAHGQQWHYQNHTEFCIALAPVPKQIAALLPVLIGILQLDARIMLSINETLCGEYGLDLLTSGFEQHDAADLLERITLFQQDDFCSDRDIAEHLLASGLLLSTGNISYDYAALQRRVPMLLTPVSGYTQSIMTRFDLPDETQLLPALQGWLEDPEQWLEWVLSYQQQCQNLSAAPEHFDTMQNLMGILFHNDDTRQ